MHCGFLILGRCCSFQAGSAGLSLVCRDGHVSTQYSAVHDEHFLSRGPVYCHGPSRIRPKIGIPTFSTE